MFKIDSSLITNSWFDYLKPELDKEYIKDLEQKISQEYESGRTIFPPKNEIFNAFNSANFEDVKVVIIGQDPYHGFGQANGLCFSVKEGVKHPPSLVNIFKELENDLGLKYPVSGDLSHWANQGVFLLNSILTVEESKAASHKKIGWRKFTDSVIQKLSDSKENLVFILWGGFAHKKIRFIDTKKHHIIKSGHPSPLSANRGYWFGNRSFSRCNEYLKEKEVPEIDWNLNS